MRAHVAEALHAHRRAFEIEAAILGPLGEAVHHPLPRRLRAPHGAAARDGLAGDHTLDALLVRGADHVRVSVHHPRHRLAVRAHVRRGDVVLGADVLAERVREAARDAGELRLRHRARVELDAALAAAVRQAHQRALPRHHRRERLDLVERHHRRVAHAALERTEDVVVLNAVALEEPHLAVIHLHREVHDDLVLRLAEDGRDVRREVDHLRRPIEVPLHDAEEVVLVANGACGRGRGGDALRARAGFDHFIHNV